MRLTEPARRVLAQLCLVLGSAFSAMAQIDEEPIVKAEFTVYSLHRLSDLHFVDGDRKGSSPLTFYSSARSNTYEYEGINPIIFFREDPSPTTENPTAVKRVKVGEVTLPPGRGRYLLIFFPDKDTEAEDYHVYPLDDSTSALPYGCLKLFNATPYTLEGIVGRERVQLKPGPSGSFRMQGSSISVGLGFSYEGTFHQSYNSPIRLNKESRGLMMIFPPFVKGSAIVQTRLLREGRKEEESGDTSARDPVTPATGS